MSYFNGMTLHTFELSMNITKDEAQVYSNYLYEEATRLGARCYRNNGWLNFYGYQKVGIKISLRFSENAPVALIRLRINPSVLSGNTDPTELFLPDRTHMDSITALLGMLTQDLLGERTIYDFALNRLDLCRNVYLENQEILTEYLRLLNKGANRSNWNKECFGDERDAHSFRRYCAAYEVTVYDKIYELQQEDRSRYQQDPFQWTRKDRILRVETSLLRDGIRRQIEKLDITSSIAWPDLMVKFSEAGPSIMSDLLDQLVTDSTYYRLDKARTVIECSGFRRNKTDKLCEFLSKINQKQSLDTSKIRKMKNGEKRLQQFYDLDINPVTIEARAGINTLPSIQELLKKTPV